MIKGYKFLVNEEEKSRILNLHKNRTSSQYLILEYKEELTLPQTKTITFSSNDADSAHKIKDADVEKEVRPLLNSIYNSGKNPKFTDATMKIDGKNGAYTTTVTLTIDESKNGIAYMGFTFRGSIGPNWEKRADGQIDGSENKDKLSMLERIKTKLNGNNMDIFKTIDGKTQDTPPLNFREYFIQFSKNDKPSHSQNSSSETTNTNSEEKNNSQSQTQTKPKIEFQKPTDHKTALDQIKNELNVQQGDNISDAVLKFLKDNTPKN
jgi:hypothetical protein